MKDRREVEAMTGPELVAYYNQITGGCVKRFSSRAAGVQRVLAALERARAEEEIAPPEPCEPTPDSREVGQPRKRGRSGAGARRYEPEGELRPPRAGSKRAQLLERLSSAEGMSWDEMEEEFGWSPRDCMDALRLLARQNGYGVMEGAEGRWRVFS